MFVYRFRNHLPILSVTLFLKDELNQVMSLLRVELIYFTNVFVTTVFVIDFSLFGFVIVKMFFFMLLYKWVLLV